MSNHDPFNTPEKRYVRDQWFNAARVIKKNNNVAFINYCTFPGRNCHDVIRLKSLLKTKEIGKTFYDEKSLTFFEKDIELITEIRNKLPGARFFNGFFEDFVKAAWEGRNIRPGQNSTEINPFDYFPYDVINLDYTGPGFKHNGKKTSSEMSSIYSLFEIQA
ncbi:MAG: hypothetical protein ACFFG0_38645, partial [Candidatus Thorarchaeota archaeon]